MAVAIDHRRIYYVDPSMAGRLDSWGSAFDHAASLGFSANVVDQFGGAKYFPLFDFDTLTDIGDNLAGNTTHAISIQSSLQMLVPDP